MFSEISADSQLPLPLTNPAPKTYLLQTELVMHFYITLVIPVPWYARAGICNLMTAYF